MKNRFIRKAVICLVAAIIVSFASRTAFAEYDFGKDAEENLRKIDEAFGMRIGGTEQHEKMKDWLLESIRSYGYEPEELPFHDQGPLRDKYYDGVNIQFEKPGQTNETIIVCAHYDCVDTNGAEDNGTGVSVLLELAKRFYNIETKYTIRFVLFDEEENLLVGSMYYESHEDLSDVICLCNLDCLGVGDDMYAYGGATENLNLDWPLMQFKTCADACEIPVQLHLNEGTYSFPSTSGMSDHNAFLQANIPYVFLAAGYWPEGESTYDNPITILDTADPSVSEGRIIHNPEYDNLAYIESHFGRRIFDHMAMYSEAITYFLQFADPAKSTDDVTNDMKTILDSNPIIESEEITESETENQTSEQNSTESIAESKTDSSIEAMDGDGTVQKNQSSKTIYVVAGVVILLIFAVFIVIIRKRKK